MSTSHTEIEPRRVTDFGETEMLIRITDAAKLPRIPQEYIRMYGWQGADGYWHCRVPNYRVQELLDAQRLLTDPDWQCSCVGTFGANAECGCCGGAGTCRSERCASHRTDDERSQP